MKTHTAKWIRGNFPAIGDCAEFQHYLDANGSEWWQFIDKRPGGHTTVYVVGETYEFDTATGKLCPAA